MFIRPAAAPSWATGLAASLMRRRRRPLQEAVALARSLARLFLSFSQTAEQVRREEGGKRGTCCEILRNTFSSRLLGAFKSFFSIHFHGGGFLFSFTPSPAAQRGGWMSDIVTCCFIPLFPIILLLLLSYYLCIH